jgi:glyoxylate/hydroxypyruvate reductase
MSVSPLTIAFCCPTIDAQPWADALAKRLPQAHIEIWPNCRQAADYAITWSPIQAFFDVQPAVKAVFALGAGVDSLLRLNLLHDLKLVRIEDGGMGAQMADYVTHAVLRHLRRFDVYEKEIRAGQWIQHPAQDHAAYPVGVLGLGELGSQIALRMRDLGFAVAGWSRSLKTLQGITCFSGDQLPAFLTRSRVLICALPLTAQTQDILCEANLKQLQAGAFLINVARGAHLVEADLLKLLDSGHIAGACLDVLRTEPAPAEHLLRLHPRITLTPHIAALTLLEPSVEQISQKIIALQSGQAITGVVQRERGY